ncbi:MAG: YqgE/AlgH family protein [Odoribacteraceae bacterium]|jgi:putative transcriptional regulator|nr:YqgE/AlgH family protein [Odoribacteraceae bacterium]
MKEQFQYLSRTRHDGNRVKAGQVLIADPLLQGSMFNRSVIYMVEHNDRGSVGFVLNKPLPHTMAGLLHALKGVECLLYAGGPVEPNRLYYLHRLPEIGGMRVLPGEIYWGGDSKMLMRMLRDEKVQPNEVRFFVGYSGWGSGQLKEELEEHSWFVGDMGADRVFSPSIEGLWSDAMSALGGQYCIRAVFPEDPMMN